jgi:DNA processing protein
MQPQRRLSDEERINWLRLARTENVGPVTFHALVSRFGTAGAAIDALPDLSARGGRARPIAVYARNRAEDDLATVHRLKAKVVAAGEIGYPPFLRHVHAAPPLLYVAGNLDLVDMDSVGVVGARNASALGLKFSRMIARTLVENHMLVVSGLARGIDTAAHEASLDQATAAVLAGGLDHIYPPENAKLHQAIAERGVLITEMPPGTAPKAEHFPRRNRIISGMSRAVVVVEAALRSGSLITARFAAEQGRDVFAVPGSPLDPRAEGCNKLIKDGAQILTSVDDLVQSLRMIPPPRTDVFLEQEQPDTLLEISNSDRDHLLTFLSPTETHIDDLIRESRMPTDVVTAIVLELEIAGRVVRASGGRLALA